MNNSINNPFKNMLTDRSPSIIKSKKRKNSLILSKIKNSIKDPRLALTYIILGKKRFYHLNYQHSCFSFSDTTNYLEFLMIQPSVIHEHLSTLYMLTVEFNLKNILELGTQFGVSTIALLTASKEIQGSVTTIDIDPCIDARKTVKDLNLDNFCKFIQADDTQVEWNEPIDHLFIDSKHSYNHVLKQLKKYEPYVNSGGLITLHDIVMHEFLPNGEPTETITGTNSVLRAINKYLENRKDLKLYKYFNCNGLGIIRKS